MATAWETLFHLSNFMKHLLIEVLPKENLDCPKYVGDSLFELLSITLECLNFVRNGHEPEINSLRRRFQESIENAVTASLESSTKKQNKRRNNYPGPLESHENNSVNHHDINPNHHSPCKNNEIPVICQPINTASSGSNSNYTAGVSYRISSTENVPAVTMHKSTIINQHFITLSSEMVSGKPFGYYCLPCDGCFSNETEWNNHNSNTDHFTRIKKQHCEEIICKKCNLLVFGNFTIAPIYLDFHSQAHQMSSHSSSECSSKRANPSKQDFPFENQASGQFEQLKNRHSPKDLFYVSPNFEKIQTNMAKGLKKEGFYCSSCDKKCGSTGQWAKHFEKIKHSNQTGTHAPTAKMCNTCPFIIFAPEDVLNGLMKYHMDSHFYFSENQHTGTTTMPLKNTGEKLPSSYVENSLLTQSNDKINESHKVDSISRSTSKSELDENTISLSSKGKYNSESDVSSIKDQIKPKNRKDYKISNNFIYVNEKIHSEGLVGAYFCRPCDQSCILEQWKEHCNLSKHKDFMNSKTFKNVQGVCTYCMLTIIGTERTVHEYMRFHNERHEKVLSYSLDSLNERVNDLTKAHCQEKERKRTPRHKEKKNHNSNDSIGDNIKNVSPGTISHANSTSSLSTVKASSQGANDYTSIKNNTKSEEKSCYDSSRDETIQGKIDELYRYRVKEIASKKNPAFGGFCIPCEMTFETAFDWMDHIYSDDHLEMKSANDEEFYFSDFNMHIFGNKTVIPQFLFNG